MRVLVNIDDNGKVEPVVFEAKEVGITDEFSVVLDEDTAYESIHSFSAPYVLQIQDMNDKYMYIPVDENFDTGLLIEVLQKGYVDLRNYGLCVYDPDDSDFDLLRNPKVWDKCKWKETIVSYKDSNKSALNQLAFN